MGWEIALTVASSAFKAFSAMQAGKEEARAAQIQARQAELDAQSAELRGRDEALAVRKDAWSVRMGNVAAARGYDPYSSMSWLAVDDDIEGEAEYAANNAVLNAENDRDRFLTNASLQRKKASSARRSGIFGAAGALFSGGIKLAKLK